MSTLQTGTLSADTKLQSLEYRLWFANTVLANPDRRWFLICCLLLSSLRGSTKPEDIVEQLRKNEKVRDDIRNTLKQLNSNARVQQLQQLLSHVYDDWAQEDPSGPASSTQLYSVVSSLLRHKAELLEIIGLKDAVAEDRTETLSFQEDLSVQQQCSPEERYEIKSGYLLPQPPEDVEKGEGLEGS